MNEINTVTPNSADVKGKYAIVASQWNSYIVNSLVDGAVSTLTEYGIIKKDITIVKCPGAFEIPLVAQKIAETKKYDAIICLGAIIKGATPHFDYVAAETAKGISCVMLKFDIPVTFGILTVDTIEQAIERAGTKMGNKGIEVTKAALDMVSVIRQIK